MNNTTNLVMAVSLFGLAAGSLPAAAAPTPSASVSGGSNVDQKTSGERSIDRERRIDVKDSSGTERRTGTESKHDNSKSSDASVDMSGGNWFMRAMSAHGSTEARGCVAAVTNHFAGRVSRFDVDGDMLEAAGAGLKDTSTCALALDLAGRAVMDKLGRRAGLLPDPASQASLGLLGGFDFGVLMDRAAGRIASDVRVDASSKGSGMTWSIQPYTFRAESGVLSVFEAGRTIFDADHIGGKRYTFRVAADDRSTNSSTSSASASTSSSTDTTASQRKAIGRKTSRDSGVSGSSSVGPK